MSVAIVFNPVSGAGRSQAMAKALAEQIERAGMSTAMIPTPSSAADDWLDDALSGARALVVAGGDGTVRLSLAAAARCDVPLYHYPCGTENLFAREFGMGSSPSEIIRAIAVNRTQPIDLGQCNGRAFVLMVSIGYDAEVVHQLASRRGAAISHSSYIWPMVRQFFGWSPPRMSVVVDGKTLVDHQTGIVIVANSRQYAWRLDPVLTADMSDGLLDVVFLPMRSRLGLLAWAARCARRRQMRHRDIKMVRGSHCHIKVDSPGAGAGPGAAVQLDGDPAGRVGVDGANPQNRCESELEIILRPGALRVLLPAAPPSENPADDQVPPESLR